MDLHVQYRPRKLENIVGQESAVKKLNSWLKRKSVPHFILLSGPSGCGKTTIARIMAKELKCNRKVDFREINCADDRGIETARSIIERKGLKPIAGKTRCWLIDEAHQLMAQTQNALLKILEEPPEWAYFFLATTEPRKLIDTIQTRASEVKVSSLKDEEVKKLLEYVIYKEDKKVKSKVLDRIVEVCEGSARKSLVILQSIIDLDSSDEQIKAIEEPSLQTDSILICRALINGKTQWPEMAKILKEVDLAKNYEGLRALVLGYMKSCMLGGGFVSSRAFAITQIFRDHLFDSREAGFIANCYEVVMGSRK